MRIWTAQETGFYNDLMANGIAYCTKVSEIAIDNGYGYEWMAGYYSDSRKQDRKADAIPLCRLYFYLSIGVSVLMLYIIL